jgi:hypothetical protein
MGGALNFEEYFDTGHGGSSSHPHDRPPTTRKQRSWPESRQRLSLRAHRCLKIEPKHLVPTNLLSSDCPQDHRLVHPSRLLAYQVLIGLSGNPSRLSRLRRVLLGSTLRFFVPREAYANFLWSSVGSSFVNRDFLDGSHCRSFLQDVNDVYRLTQEDQN